MQTSFWEEATCRLKKWGSMKNSMALGVPSWKSSSFTWGLLTVCLHSDFILDKEVGMGGRAELSKEQWPKRSPQRNIKPYRKGKLNFIEDNWSFLVSSVCCPVGGHWDCVTIPWMKTLVRNKGIVLIFKGLVNVNKFLVNSRSLKPLLNLRSCNKVVHCSSCLLSVSGLEETWDMLDQCFPKCSPQDAAVLAGKRSWGQPGWMLQDFSEPSVMLMRVVWTSWRGEMVCSSLWLNLKTEPFFMRLIFLGQNV